MIVLIGCSRRFIAFVNTVHHAWHGRGATAVECGDKYTGIPLVKMLPNGTELCFGQDAGREIVPRLCKNESAELLRARRAFTYTVSETIESVEAPTVYLHAVMAFQAGGAQRYLNDVRSSVTSCAAHTWEGIRIKYSHATGPQAGQVSVIYDQGSEGNPSKDQTVHEATVAASRLL